MIANRLKALCQNVASDARLTCGGFADLPAEVQPKKVKALRADMMRTNRRRLSQGLSYMAYEARLLPAKLAEFLHRK